MGIRNPLQSILPDIGLQQSGVGIRPIDPAGQRQLGGAERLPGGVGGVQLGQTGLTGATGKAMSMFDTSQEDIDDLNRNLAIKEAVGETVKSGKMSDGRGGINIKEIAIALAPLLAAGVGAAVGGKKGAEAGAALGSGFSRGVLNQRDLIEAKRFKAEELDIKKAVALGQIDRTAAATRLSDLQAETLESGLLQQPSPALTEFLSVVGDDPTRSEMAAAIEMYKGSKDSGVQTRVAYMEHQLKALGGKNAIPDNIMSEVINPLNKAIIAGEMVTDGAYQLAVSDLTARGMDHLIPAAQDYFVAQRFMNSKLDMSVLGEKLTQNMFNAATVVQQSSDILDLVKTKEVGELMSIFAKAKTTLEIGLTGEIKDPRLQAVANRLRILTEFYARDKSGAAIGKDERAEFQEQVGRLGLTQKALIERLSTMMDTSKERVRSLVRSVKKNALGFDLMSEERQRSVIDRATSTILPEERRNMEDLSPAELERKLKLIYPQFADQEGAEFLASVYKYKREQARLAQQQQQWVEGYAEMPRIDPLTQSINAYERDPVGVVELGEPLQGPLPPELTKGERYQQAMEFHRDRLARAAMQAASRGAVQTQSVTALPRKAATGLGQAATGLTRYLTQPPPSLSDLPQK